MLGELLLVVLRFVESHDERNAHLLEDWNVVFRSERAILVCRVQRPRERDESAWHRPVQVSILDLLVVLVLDHVELAVVVPSQLDR